MSMVQRLKLMAGKQYNFFSKKKLKKFGWIAFTFFLLKGFLWLILGGSILSMMFIS